MLDLDLNPALRAELLDDEVLVLDRHQATITRLSGAAAEAVTLAAGGRGIPERLAPAVAEARLLELGILVDRGTLSRRKLFAMGAGGIATGVAIMALPHPAAASSHCVGTALPFDSTTPGTYQVVIPAGVTSVRVHTIGGGARGGGDTVRGGGGGGGGYAAATIAVVECDVLNVTVGAGSSDPLAPNGTSSVVTGTAFSITATGGSGGVAGSANTVGPGGAGGGGTVTGSATAPLTSTGGTGGGSSTGQPHGGGGGAAGGSGGNGGNGGAGVAGGGAAGLSAGGTVPGGNGGLGGSNGAGQIGQPGAVPGGGGGGSGNQGPGAGTNGRVRIEAV